MCASFERKGEGECGQPTTRPVSIHSSGGWLYKIPFFAILNYLVHLIQIARPGAQSRTGSLAVREEQGSVQRTRRRAGSWREREEEDEWQQYQLLAGYRTRRTTSGTVAVNFHECSFG